MSGVSPGTVIAKEKAVFVTKLEEEPQLGGEGSGFPPRFLVATGSLGHAIIGIDIGAHWTRVASVIHNRPQLITEPVSSILRITDGQIDNVAAATKALDPSHSLLSLIGTDWDLESPAFSIESILHVFLRRLIDHSQKGAEHLIKKCVLTVPASFSSERRRILREVVENAGLEVLNLINEQTAAALAYVHADPSLEGNMLIFGMGARHFAASLIETRNGLLETRATSADGNLGGDDFDDLLIDWFFEQFESRYGMPLPRVRANLEKFRFAAEAAKMDLSMSCKTHIRLTQLETARHALDFEQYNLFLELDRSQFTEITQRLISKAMQHVHTVLLESRLNASDVDYIIPIGWSSQMPVLMDALKVIFPSKRSFHQANFLPHASALGAALQASILTRTLRDFVVWDVLAVPISVELPDGRCKVIISSGTPLPITAYHQVDSSDATVNLHVLQGYSEIAQENCSIAEVAVNNCPPTSSANTKVEIAVMVRADGTTDFSAKHVELQVNLPVNVRRGYPTKYTQRAFEKAPDAVPKRTRDSARLTRLCRKLNMPEADTLSTLKTLGYRQSEIDEGTAIETLIRALRRKKKKD